MGQPDLHDGARMIYKDPSVYDLIYGGATADQFASLCKVAASCGAPPAGPWLETACGTGRLLVPAAAAGIAVAGFDLELRMVEFARARLPADAELRVADLTDCGGAFDGRTFPFAFTLVNTIRHLDSDDALLAHLSGMAALLAPGGVYVVGLSLIRPGEDEIEEDVWRGSDGERTVTEVSTALPPAPGTRAETIIRHITIERAGAPPEHRDESFPLRTYTQEEWETAIERSALRVRAVFGIWGERATPFSGGYFLYALASR
jgi:hypothetical protein